MTDEEQPEDIVDFEDAVADEPFPVEESQNTSEGREVYHVVTDIGFGPNLRMSDNCFQAAFIFISVLLGVGIGALIGGVDGAVLGGFAGLVGGLILSGIILMIYRAVQHAKGRHD